jgi:hypothetical protein
MMRRYIVSLVGVSLSVGACAHGPPVNDAETALAIGQKICEQEWAEWGRMRGRIWTMEPAYWHVGLKGDQWEVWTDGNFAGLGVYIPRSGASPSRCADILEPAFFRK